MNPAGSVVECGIVELGRVPVEMDNTEGITMVEVEIGDTGGWMTLVEVDDRAVWVCGSVVDFGERGGTTEGASSSSLSSSPSKKFK